MACGLDAILTAAENVKEAILIDLTDITGVIPSTAQRLFGASGIAQIAKHHVVTLITDLSAAIRLRVVDVQHRIRESETRRAVTVAIIAIHCGERSTFGKTVALHGKYAQLAQTLLYGGRHRLTQHQQTAQRAAKEGAIGGKQALLHSLTGRKWPKYCS